MKVYFQTVLLITVVIVFTLMISTWVPTFHSDITKFLTLTNLVTKNSQCPSGGLFCEKFDNDDIGIRLLKFNRSTKYCENLVDSWATFNMSKTFYDLLPDFQVGYKTATAGVSSIEGFSEQVTEQKQFLHYLAASPLVKTVCETGFNVGHSSFNFLTANLNLMMYSFDLGSHVYAGRMAKLLPDILNKKSLNGSRLTVRFGDSTVEVPKSISEGKLPFCDLIFVDGGHNYPVAKSDILNLAKHSSEHNVIVFDDYPTNWGAEFGKAWDELLIPKKKADEIMKNSKLETSGASIKTRNVSIVEVLRCTQKNFQFGLERGFTVGRVILW